MRAAAALLLIAGLSAGTVRAADPGPYPGATPDPAATAAAREAMPTGIGQISVWTTDDGFDQVVRFYKAAGSEVVLPGGQPLPNGGVARTLPGEVRPGQPEVTALRVLQAVVILDGAADLMTSRNWVAISRPLILSLRRVGDRFLYEDIRDVTAITQTRQ